MKLFYSDPHGLLLGSRIHLRFIFLSYASDPIICTLPLAPISPYKVAFLPSCGHTRQGLVSCSFFLFPPLPAPSSLRHLHDQLPHFLLKQKPFLIQPYHTCLIFIYIYRLIVICILSLFVLLLFVLLHQNRHPGQQGFPCLFFSDLTDFEQQTF